MGTVLKKRNRHDKLRVLSSDGAIYGHTHHYYTAEAVEEVGRQWVGSGWKRGL
jgi:hypothetical protein